MVKHLRFLAAFLLLLTFVARSFAAEPSFEEEATRRLREATAGDTAGVAVLVARDGKILFQGGFGYADLEKKTPITPETKFRIGSVSKQFTAAAILRLAEQKKLSLDDKLSKFFPEFPKGEGVTVRQLLTHTSGIKSYTDKPSFMPGVKEPVEPAALIASFQNDPPDFEPGKGFHYNNSAYFLAGEIVAQVSGKSLNDYLTETFFKPLKMDSTGVYVNSSPPEDVARGYSLADEKLEPALDWDMSWAGGAGALYSTVGDLYRWNEALFGGKVLTEASFKAATTPVELPPNVDGMKYGYGLMMSDLKRLPVISHGGGLNGWSCYLMRLPEQRCTAVVLSNALPGPPALNPAAIAVGLAEKVLAQEIASLPAPVEDKAADPKTFADYEGRYDYKSAVMTVTVEKDALYAHLTDQPKLRLWPKGKDTFFWKEVDAQVEFARNDQGKVEAARHTQGGNTFRAAKIEDKVKLKPEQAEAFVGQYDYGNKAVLTITRDGSQLFAQMTGQPKFPIFAVSETEFEWKVVAAKVKFEQDKDGKVTKALHSQGGGTINATKIK
jgi:CubicO group peptidase (beta-lactamase class C family)